jgi:PAS domain S-box-containing protein
MSRTEDDQMVRRHARAYLAAIVESSEDAIISKDLNGIIQSCNAAAERIFGYTAAELLGQPVLMLIPPERHQEEDEILSRIRRGERVEHFETVRVRKDGRRIEVSLTVSAVRDENGVIIGASKIARDVSERHRLLAAERAARADAERANRLKDEFVAMVSHELRTPLNAILGWTQLMARSPHDVGLIERGLEVVARNTRLQAQLVSDLLDISRIVEGKLGLEIQTVNLRDVVRDSIDTVTQDAAAKNIHLLDDLPDGRAAVAGDGARLQQVIWNLLSNAIKFTPRGGAVRLALRVENRQATIQVSDTGTGIRPEALPHIFDRFHQADRSITRRYGGLGLGLAIVKHLVELHHGEVRAESAGAGKGATFTVVLPVGVAAHASAPAVTGEGPADRREPAVIEGVSVLVVEDEPDTQQFLRRLLESHGATVITTGSASEALTVFRERATDVLISDIGLPGTDGYDLMRQIRERAPEHHRVVAIALTAYARAEDRTRALRAGYQAHVTKPVDGAELVAIMGSLVNLTRAETLARPSIDD